MELGKKLVSLRKKAGLSQENLADMLEVSRQTISKWELGDTSPDIAQAKKISEIFNVSLDELLGNEITEILAAKISNTEKLAMMIIKILKTAGIILILFLLLALYFWYVNMHEASVETFEVSINDVIDCKLGDKRFYYVIKYEYVTDYSDEKNIVTRRTNRIANVYRDGGNAYLSSIIDLEKYEYGYQLYDAVYAYMDDNNGKCEKNHNYN